MHDDELSKAERIRIRLDVVKHMTTLNTGSILLSLTLFDKVHREIGRPRQFVAALTCLMTSLAFCVSNLINPLNVETWQSRLTYKMAVWLFAAGLCLLCVYAFPLIF